jgi:AraC-like DNA-binding protein
MMDSKALQNKFFKALDGQSATPELLEFLPDVQLFMKNSENQFVRAGQAFLHNCGFTHESEIIGKTDVEVFEPSIGQQYMDEDQQVMKSRRPLIDRVQLVPNSEGLLLWYLCTKIPLFDHQGEVIGLAGILRNCNDTGSLPRPYHKFEEVMNFIHYQYAQRITIGELAAKAHLSRSQFERQFKKLFHISPMKYVTKFRLYRACLQLRNQKNDTITQVAQVCGFYDHSYFTKVFTREIGRSPKVYRNES